MSFKKFLIIKKTAQVASFVALMTLLSGKVMGQGCSVTTVANEYTEMPIIAGAMGNGGATSPTESSLNLSGGNFTLETNTYITAIDWSRNTATITGNGANCITATNFTISEVGTTTIALKNQVLDNDWHARLAYRHGTSSNDDFTIPGQQILALDTNGWKLVSSQISTSADYVMTNNQTIESTFTVQNLGFTSNSTLTIESGGQLIVQGTMTFVPSATLTMENGGQVVCDKSTFQVNGEIVTVDDYCNFLNSVAGVDTYGLFADAMREDTGRNDGPCIIRSGTPDHQTYVPVDGKRGEPIVGATVPDMVRYCNWLQNGKARGLQGSDTTETGAYLMNDNTDGETGFQVMDGANDYFVFEGNNVQQAASLQVAP